MSDIQPFLAEVRELVDRALDRLVPGPEREPSRLYQAIRWSLFGEGKRFRPALVIGVGRVFDASDEALLQTAAAVEMIHTYSLIHDDLPAMDNDDLRRGRATVHRRFDESTAILAGDALQAMAFEAISNDNTISEPVRLRLVSELSIAAGKMVAGQQLDLEAEGERIDLGAIERIHAGKTGALMRFAVRAGGIIAAADDGDLERLSRFGEKLGLLFQITDDILDLTASSEMLGKTAGKDAANQKATYPHALGIDEARKLAARLANETVEIIDSKPRGNKLLVDICRYVFDRAR